MAKTFAFASPRIRILLFASPFNHGAYFLVNWDHISIAALPPGPSSELPTRWDRASFTCIVIHMFRAVVPSFQLSFGIVFTFWTQLRCIATTRPKLRATGRHAGTMLHLPALSFICFVPWLLCSSCPLVLYSHSGSNYYVQ
jgi:hypothetical protein